MKWFLYYKDLRNERVKCKPLDQGSHISISVAIEESYSAFSKAFHSSRKLKKIMITRSRFHRTYTAQKMKFSIKDFFSKCDQIRSLLRIWSHLLKKSLTENFIICAVHLTNELINLELLLIVTTSYSISIQILMQCNIFSLIKRNTSLPSLIQPGYRTDNFLHI